MSIGYTYIMGSPTGTLYVGVTSDLYERTLKHRAGTYEGFSARYNCTRLLYYEAFDDIRRAIAREKQLKGWRRKRSSISSAPQTPNSKTSPKPGGRRCSSPVNA
jgi:putative endonuclease